MNAFSILPLLLVALLLALSGVVLLVVGLRGRRVSDRPHCRRCAFDLTGVATTSPDSRCPECGASLAAPKGIRRGSRQRRRPALILGVLLLLLGVGGIGALLGPRLAGLNLNPHKPVWMLLGEASGGTTAEADLAIEELRVRLGTNTLSPAQRVQVLALAVSWHTDPAARWSPALGDLVSDALVAGLLTEDEAKAVLSASVRVDLVIRPAVRSGTSTQIALDLTSARPLGNTRLYVQVVGDDDDLTLRDSSGAARWSRAAPGWGEVSTMSGGSARSSVEAPIDAPPGLYQLEFAGTLLVATSPIAFENPSAPGGYAIPLVLRTPVTVVAPNEPVVKTVSQPAADVIARALRIESLEYVPREFPPRISFGLSAQDLPIPVAFRVELRQTRADGTVSTWPLVSLAFPSVRSGVHSHSTWSEQLQSPFPEGVCDVVLIPDVSVAEKDPEILEIWTGEPIVIPGVTIKSAPPPAPLE